MVEYCGDDDANAAADAAAAPAVVTGYGYLR